MQTIEVKIFLTVFHLLTVIKIKYYNSNIYARPRTYPTPSTQFFVFGKIPAAAKAFYLYPFQPLCARPLN